MLKKRKLLDEFQQIIFKGKVREWSPRICDHLVHDSLIRIDENPVLSLADIVIE